MKPDQGNRPWPFLLLTNTSLQTRRTCMTHQTTHTQALPKGMALIETAEGCWFPALAPLIDTPHWVTFINSEACCIPPALESQPCHDPKKGYTSRQKALEACCAWDE